MENKSQINIPRFIDQLNACFNRNDMTAARNLIVFWENEARQSDCKRELLTILNEAVGFYRRNKKKNKAINAMEECLSLIESLELSDTLSGATIFINSATTLSFFGNKEKAIELYDKAALCYLNNNKTQTFEYATLLNNKASTLYELKMYDEAENDWKQAIEILKLIGNHDGEIAISLIMLAHLTFDRDDNSYEQVEAILDESWEYITSDNQPKDGNYAYVLKKCAPSYDYFQRPMEAQALRDVAKEIYEAYR